MVLKSDIYLCYNKRTANMQTQKTSNEIRIEKWQWELVAAVILRGDEDANFKCTKLYKKALWMATPCDLTFEQFLTQMVPL